MVRVLLFVEDADSYAPFSTTCLLCVNKAARFWPLHREAIKFVKPPKSHVEFEGTRRPPQATLGGVARHSVSKVWVGMTS